MKTILLMIMLCGTGLGVTAAEVVPMPAKHKIVFEFVSDGPQQIESVLNNIQNVLKALGPETEIMAIAHGPGLGLLLKTNTKEAARIQALHDQKVVFAACENTLRRKQVSSEELLPRVVTVDSGVAEVVRRQAAGWAYIKSGH
jgi:intracellular sulfur oxidation DsrE/DsrF family protein